MGRRIGLLVCAAGVAVAGNLIRAVTLGMIGNRSGPAEVEHWHNLLGMGILIAVVLAVWWMASRSERPKSVGISDLRATPDASQGRVAGWLGSAWVVGIVVLICVWYSKGIDPGVRPALALREEVVREEPPKSVRDTLRPERGDYFHLGPVSGYHFWWSPGRGKANPFGHRPEHCMPGAGWTMTGPATVFSTTIDGQPTVWSVIPFERPDQKAVMLWGNWMDGEPLDPKEYDRLREMYFHKERTLDFVRKRISSFPFELAACLIPGEQPAPEEMTRIVRSVFRGQPTEPDGRSATLRDKLSP